MPYIFSKEEFSASCALNLTQFYITFMFFQFHNDF